MSEKVIQDIRITETEDGFHIEIKGDKEFLRHWIDRAGAFFANFGERGRGPFRGHGPFGQHHGPFGHDHEYPHGGHGPFGHHREPGEFRGHGPFGRPEGGPPHFGGFGPFGGPDSRETWREQARELRRQAQEWKRQMHEWRHQMRDLHKYGPFGAWEAAPEAREAWVRQAQEWRGQWPFGGNGEKSKRGEGHEQFRGRGPFGWRGHREKPKRYDLGPWWDEGEATDDLPTV